ncbi:exodeoxyribonuclease VII small subunit [Streptococcus lactarius]|uniref:exodeoxyribonuclease VII small subunit n=1 Tax=Streptococcus lactarius TaxID=684066 RepID=UPI003620656D
MRDGQLEVEVKHVERKKFEENLADLEAIVQKLESGDVALEEALTEFQKGMKLSKALQDTLDQAEKTLVKVMQADGTEADLA